MKGETVAEITGAARVMREKAGKIDVSNHLVNIDRDEINAEDENLTGYCGHRRGRHPDLQRFHHHRLCGGGRRTARGQNTATVRSRASAAARTCLENLGVNLDINHADVERCVNEVGIGFLYAPSFHGAMKYAAKPRREIGLQNRVQSAGSPHQPGQRQRAGTGGVLPGADRNDGQRPGQ